MLNSQVSNDGATAKKAERDAYVDTLRCKEATVSGVQRYRVRIDASSGEDFCNHVGFVAGEGYKGSALNSADSCCIEVRLAFSNPEHVRAWSSGPSDQLGCAHFFCTF